VKRAVLSLLLLAGAALLPAGADTAFDWHLPPGVTPPPVPADNAMSAAKVELGRRLFYDADLSIDGTTSCATCHEQHRAFTEGNGTHPGVRGTPGRRNVMGLANVGYFAPLTWADPRQQKLEAQALVPMMGNRPVEMGMDGQDYELARRLNSDTCYPRMFRAAFPERGGEISTNTVTLALAAFERTLISYDAPYDKFRRGDRSALSSAAQRGMAVFNDLNCASCHAGENFTDQKFHHLGLYNETEAEARPAHDHGLKDVTGAAADEGAIRTPSLRNIALTGPYMHDGSITKLGDAIRAHLKGDGARDPQLKGLAINSSQEADLLAFLDSLSDQGIVTNPDQALPRAACSQPF
jgi:cytochrome c peroxidase